MAMSLPDRGLRYNGLVPPRKNTIPPTITFRIDAKDRKQLQKIAKDRHMSEGALVGWLVKQGLLNVEDIETRFKTFEGKLAALGGRLDGIVCDLEELAEHPAFLGLGKRVDEYHQAVALRVVTLEEAVASLCGDATEQPAGEQEPAAEGSDDDNAEPEDAADAEPGAA